MPESTPIPNPSPTFPERTVETRSPPSFGARETGRFWLPARRRGSTILSRAIKTGSGPPQSLHSRSAFRRYKSSFPFADFGMAERGWGCFYLE
jgi:hypothetical protein